MTAIEALEWRYATKQFDSTKSVTKEKIDVLLNAFNLTATSYGLQPVKLVVVEDKAVQKELVKYSYNQEQVAQASHVLVFCLETEVNKAFIEAYFERVKAIRNTPDEVLASFRSFLINDFEGKTPEQIKLWATKQAYLCMGNLLTVCGLEGIDACPMEGFSPPDYDKVLNLKSYNLASVLVMPIGYRSDNDMFAGFKKVRKTLAESVIKL